ncbi:MAG: hypothetical protein PQJ46_01685 [Spirochaetales bacterium]|nr:hypothetical protein [Spirochaetales bacterium]
MADLKKIRNDAEPLIKAMAEYAKSQHKTDDPEVKGMMCNIVCAGGCAAICALGDGIAEAIGSSGGAALASKYL